MHTIISKQQIRLFTDAHKSAIRRLTAAIAIILFPALMQAQTITGVVRDAQTRAPLEGAAVYHPASGIGVVTNPAGQFRLVLTTASSASNGAGTSGEATPANATGTSAATASPADARTDNGSTAGLTIAVESTNTTSALSDQGSSRETRPADNEIRISYVGYRTENITVDLTRDTEISVSLIPAAFLSDEILVLAQRVDDSVPMTYTNISRDEIDRQNTGRDVPFLIQNTPSVVSTSDAGAGVGYTGIRIRGVDDTRINVTINGIPLNDSESHGVFWVNMPDFSSSVGSVQVQRGVGTSTNGPAAFGATLNLQTDMLQADAHARSTLGFGSFNTQRYNLQLGTGLLSNGWSVEGRLSQITSDGFIDRAESDLSSWYLSASRYSKNDLLKIVAFSGSERTYQAWNGVPEARLRNDVAGMNFYADQHGLSAAERERLLNANGRTYNMFTYDNQIDRYSQSHYQLHYSRRFNPEWSANASLHYTRGLGYFEEFRPNDRLSTYLLPPAMIGGSTIARTDIIRRRWLDNHFVGAVLSADFRPTDRLHIVTGGGYNVYDGDHYGEVIWARVSPDANIRHRYYDNNGRKADFNAYAKANVWMSDALSVYADVQVRTIDYTFLGPVIGNDGVRRDLDQTVNYAFFNPKAGAVYRLGEGQRAYISYAVANKEPVRRELTRTTPESRPTHETLYNLEAGYRIDRNVWYAGVNLYHMNYDNQLILTGQINDVGAAVRTNVKDSYRMGVELEGGWVLSRQLQALANLTLSQNIIPEFIEFIDTSDENWNPMPQTQVVYTNTPIALSPSVVGSATLRYQHRGWSADFISKYVSRQYLDNAGLTSRSIDPYLVNEVLLGYRVDTGRFARFVEVNLHVMNLFDVAYETNGYTYAWITGAQENRFNFLYPQAGRHFMLQVSIGM
jgi:iron complex outermembrane recepter protein